MLISYLQAAILGIVQGITEYLPISSTGHLVVLQTIFGLDQSVYGLSFDMFTNIGTLVALIYFFRKDVATLIKNFTLLRPGKILSSDQKLSLWIVGATIIVAIVGVFFEPLIATELRSLEVIAASLIVVGIVMAFADRKGKKISSSHPLTAPKAYAIGLSQMIAFIPGVSRSGITMSTGLFAGLTAADAARVSFLFSIPITTAAVVKRMITWTQDVLTGGIEQHVLLFYLIGLVTATIAAYYSIKFLLDYLKKYGLGIFIWYRILFGTAIFIYLAIS